jgi:ABC-type amino acid transport substrate-binding protein
MRIKFYLTVSCLVSICVSSSLFATTLYVPIIPGVFSVDRTGYFDKVIIEASHRANISFDYQYQPFARALASFQNNSDACFPLGNHEMAKVYLNLPVVSLETGYYETKYILATLKNQNTIQSTSELKTKRIAHLRGDNPVSLNMNDFGAIFTEVTTHEQSIRMLKANRIDVIMGANTDMVEFMNDIHFNSDMVVFLSRENLICHRDSGNDSIVSQFSKAIETMREDGTLNQMLGPLAPTR